MTNYLPEEKKQLMQILINQGMLQDPKNYISKMHGAKLDIYENYIYKGDKVIHIIECEVS